MADYSQAFGEAVRRALGNRTYRQIGAKAGLSASYIGDMVQGRIPAADKVLAFAQATGADAPELLRLAGYGGLEDEYPGRTWLHRGLDELKSRYPWDWPVIFRMPTGELTVGEASRLLEQQESYLRKAEARGREEAINEAQRLVEEAAGARRSSGEVAFWQLYGEAYKELDAEGVPMVLPHALSDPIRWEEVTPDQAQQMVAKLKEISRRFHRK